MSTQNNFKSTSYSELSNDNLYSMFRMSQWSSLSETQKTELCQEVVNRDCMAMGMTKAPTVSFDRSMSSTTLGEQSGNSIRLNASAFLDGTVEKNINGEIITAEIRDNNMLALETLFHENQHAYQNQVINDEIAAKNEAAAAQYKSNDFTVSQVDNGNGKEKGLQYLFGETQGEKGYFMYYFQSTERDAHYVGEKKADYIREYLSTKYGNENSFDAYSARLQNNGYNAMLERAKAEFNNENIEKEINNVLMNNYYGTNYPASPEVKAAVEKEMALSYKEAVRMSQDKNMSLDTDKNAENMQDAKTGVFAAFQNNSSPGINENNETGLNGGTATDSSEMTSDVEANSASVASDSGISDDNDGGIDSSGGMDSSGGIDF